MRLLAFILLAGFIVFASCLVWLTQQNENLEKRIMIMEAEVAITKSAIKHLHGLEQ